VRCGVPGGNKRGSQGGGVAPPTVLLLTLICLLACVLPVQGGPARREGRRRLLALTDSLYANGAPDSAQTLLAANIPLAREAADSSYLLELLFRQGAQLSAFGRHQGAEPILREALALAEARGDSQLTCMTLRWLALAVSNLGRLDDAEDLTQRQHGLAVALDMPRLAGWAEVALGWYADRRGQPEMAVREYRTAIATLADAGDAQGVAWARNCLGISLQAAGDYQAARRSYQQAAAEARGLGYTMVEAMAVNNLGTLEFSWGDPGLAIGMFREAHALQSRLGHVIESIRTEVNVAECLMVLGRLEEAGGILELAVREAEEQAQPEIRADALSTLASLRQRQGLFGASAQLARRVIAESADLPPKDRSEALRLLALSLAQQDSLAAALQALEAGALLYASEPFSLEALVLDLCRGRLLVESGNQDRSLAILRRVELETARQGMRAMQVEALTLLARAYRELALPDRAREALGRAALTWEAARDLPFDPEWREQRGSSGSEIYTEWAALGLQDAEQPPSPALVAEIFAQLQRFKARTLLERMYGPGSALAAAIASDEASLVTLAQLQREVLQEGELLLDAYLGPRLSLAFAVTRQECRVLSWPDATELARRLELFRDLHLLPIMDEVGPAEAAALERVGKELGELLLGELPELLARTNRLIVSPDGPLNLLPWASLTIPLPGGSGGSLPLAGLEIISSPSATILAALRNRISEDAPEAAPRLLAHSGGRSSRGHPLPGTRKEVRWLARTFTGVEAVSERDSLPLYGLAAWRPYGVLHLAAHARTRDTSPWQSEIRMAGAGPAATVTAAEIAGARITASLTVLAGCESAGGRILSGEGVQGLTSAFLSAGSRCVLATLWPVDDAATLEFTRRFYTALAAGNTAAASLRAAQQALRADERSRHPFFWSGFVLVGDGDVQVILRRKPPPWALYAAAAIAVALLGLGWRRRRGIHGRAE
jgi:tetratricopeptide (TPR) repeat protein